MEATKESVFYIELPNKVQSSLTGFSSHISKEVYNILDFDRIYQVCTEEGLIWAVIFLGFVMKGDFCISLDLNLKLSRNSQKELKRELIELNERVFNGFQ